MSVTEMSVNLEEVDTVNVSYYDNNLTIFL